MFFLLSKALLFLISPFTWFIASFLGALFLRSPKWKAICKWSSIGIFLFFTNSFIVLECCRLYEVPGTPAKKVGHYEVGIVLTGMAEYNNDIQTLSIRRGADRIWQAINLYHQGKIEKILISGDHGYVTDRGLHEARQLKKILVRWGIPSTDIIAENRSRNTHENAVESNKILVRSYPHVKKVLLITSGTHMPRAKACFDKVGRPCDMYSTDLHSSPSRNYFWDQYLIPAVDNFDIWNKLIKEWVGYISYDIAGYI